MEGWQAELRAEGCCLREGGDDAGGQQEVARCRLQAARGLGLGSSLPIWRLLRPLCCCCSKWGQVGGLLHAGKWCWGGEEGLLGCCGRRSGLLRTAAAPCAL